MSLPVTVPDDYTGSVNISQNEFRTEDFQAFITEYERVYIRLLLNDLIYSEIESQSPLEQKYTDLIDGVTYVDDDGDTRVNIGLKQSLLNFVYYHYVGDVLLNTATGLVRNKNENSTPSTSTQNAQTAMKRFNHGLEIYEDDICQFLDTYSNVTGTITGSVDNTGTYTLSTASTQYLENGDTVTINGEDYVVLNVVLNVSFDITEATTGLDFTGDDFKYKPFEDINRANLKYQWL